MTEYDAEAWARKQRERVRLRQEAKGQTIVLVNCVVCQTPMKSRSHCPLCGCRDNGLSEKKNKVTKNRVKDADDPRN